MGRRKCPKVEIVGSGEENIRTVKTKHMLQRLRGGEQEISWSSRRGRRKGQQGVGEEA